MLKMLKHVGAIGTGVFIFHMYKWWDYYLSKVSRSADPHDLTIYDIIQNMTGSETSASTASDPDKLPFYTFLVVCFATFAFNLFQAFMGFSLTVATLGRDQIASIRISSCWIRTSAIFLFFLFLKAAVLITAFVTRELNAEWDDFGITIFEVIFRILSIVWVTKFILFLKWQAEFDCVSCRAHTRPRP